MIGLVVAVGAFLAMVLSVSMFGFVSGLEFSPHQFGYRSFSYYQLPLVRIQILPITRDDISLELVDYLHANGYLKSSMAGGRWDLVHVKREDTIGRADAEFLYRVLARKTSSNDSFWLEWTKSHERLAEVVWPEVQRLAVCELYFLIPELMEVVLAQKVDDIELLRKAIDSHLSQVLEFHATTQSELGNKANAIELLEEALKHMTDDSAAGRLHSLRKELEIGSSGSSKRES